MCIYIGNGNSNVSGNNDQRVAGAEKKKHHSREGEQ